MGVYLMKRIFMILAVLITVYVIYIDLSEGTLQTKVEEPSIEVQAHQQTSLQYFQQEVQAGDTVLTIIDGYTEGGISVSLETIVKDFKSLNNNLNPEDMQIGKTYLFPTYN